MRRKGFETLRGVCQIGIALYPLIPLSLPSSPLLPPPPPSFSFQERFRTPLLDFLAPIVSALSDEEFYLILFPLLYWGPFCNPRLGMPDIISSLLRTFHLFTTKYHDYGMKAFKGCLTNGKLSCR